MIIDVIRERIVRNSVILIDRLDYLIIKNGFKETLNFIQKITELMLVRKGILLLQIDDATLTGQEKSIIEKETNTVDRRFNLPEELFLILEFIRTRNSLGNKPSFTEINKEFNITENTSRKRVRELESMEFVREIKRRTRIAFVHSHGISCVEYRDGT